MSRIAADVILEICHQADVEPGIFTVIHTWGRDQRKRKLTAVCSHQTRIGNLDAHLI